MVEAILMYISDVPLSTSIPVVIAFAILISFLGSYFINDIYTYPELAANNQIVGMKFGLFGEVFAVSLGLALVGAYSLYMSVREISSSEVAALRSLYYTATDIDESQSGRGELIMKQAIVNYAKSVVQDEWELQAVGKKSDKTTLQLKGMFDAFLEYNEKTILNAAQVDYLGDVVKMRGLRTSVSTRTITQIVWVILVAGVLLVFVGPAFIGSQSLFVQTLISSLFSAFVLLNLLALVHLAHPFTGEIAVQADAYVDFIEETERLGAKMEGHGG